MKYRRSKVGRTYFFTIVTHQRRPILTTQLGRSCLRTAIKSIQKGHPFDIAAIVLLPDHIHTIWTLPIIDSDYSTRIRLVKSKFTKLWLSSHGQEGITSTSRESKNEKAIWQRRFYEHTCRDELDMKRCVDYLHVNPVKHRLVEKVKEWPWSTFHRYVKLGEYSMDWGNSSHWYGDEFKNLE
ncbi:MAG TPA: transposase [Planctomycetaceae bacterium]|nr:transposase [Planctomycetaceae bacterium]